MRLLGLARRLLCASALLMIGGIAISVMTRDAWLLVGHIADVASAVMIFSVAGLRHFAAKRPMPPSTDNAIDPHEQGLTGLD
jgi:hypothetical protein